MPARRQPPQGAIVPAVRRGVLWSRSNRPSCNPEAVMQFLRISFALLAMSAAALGGEATSPVGKTIENFKLQDYLGSWHELKDFSDHRAVVVVFLGAECPLAKLYAPRLVELAKEYGPRGAAFVGIDANQQDSLAEIARYADAHGIDFPLLKDPGNRVADQFGAVRTPEAFLLDRRRVVRYWG